MLREVELYSLNIMRSLTGSQRSSRSIVVTWSHILPFMIGRAATVLDSLKFLDKVSQCIIMTTIKSTVDKSMHKCFDTFIT